VYRIATQITQNGATLETKPGFFVPHRDRRTLKKRLAELEDDLTYTANQLNVDVDVDVVSMPQLRLIIQTFRDRLFTDIFPGRSEVPKTLVFAKIDLQAVTPDTQHKTRFVIVDAVGVCERDKTQSKPLDRKPSVSLEQALSLVKQGVVHADVVSTLAARLARLAREVSAEQAVQIKATAGVSIEGLTASLLESIDTDRNLARAIMLFQLDGSQNISDASKASVDTYLQSLKEGVEPPSSTEPTEAQRDAAEEHAMAEALKPFHDPKLRELLIQIKGSLEQVIDEVTEDTLLQDGFDEAARAKAQKVMGEFREFCETHKDEIEALQLLYLKPHRAGLRYAQVKELAKQLNRAPFHLDPAKPQSIERLWECQRAAEPTQVKGDAKSLVDLNALVRHALHPQEPVQPLLEEINARYREWLGQQAGRGIVFTPEQREWLDMIKNHMATSLPISRDDFEDMPFAGRGGLGRVYQLFGEQLETVLDELNERLAA